MKYLETKTKIILMIKQRYQEFSLISQQELKYRCWDLK